MKVTIYYLFSILIAVLLGIPQTDIVAQQKKKINDHEGIRNGQVLGTDSTYRFNVNNIDMPINNRGVLSNVAIDGNPDYLSFDGYQAMFAGGFMLSGKSNEGMWVNGVSSSSRIEDYVPGSFTKPYDAKAKLYVLKKSDGDFTAGWTNWKDAVALGAYYYDGDSNGEYNPIDINGNNKWDSNEDRPDLLGDETVWCIYSDTKDTSLRRYNTVTPKGIEIRQSVFAVKNNNYEGNMVFLRYSILNTGIIQERYDSVLFSLWNDNDLGDYVDDLVGCDIELNIGYTYNEGSDYKYGNNPPVVITKLMQGPVVYIPTKTFIDNNNNGTYEKENDTAIDTAYDARGAQRGLVVYPGAKNLDMSSFVHFMSSHPTQGDPQTVEKARFYMEGRSSTGKDYDPCNLSYGSVFGGVNCITVDSRYMYSGDPVKSVGWINTLSTDQRQVLSVGPFTIEKNKAVDIIAAYIIARGTSDLNSISLGREYSKIADGFIKSNYTVLNNENIENPINFILLNNYPNPFNPSTTIEYSISQSGYVELDVYSLLGEKVASLVSDYKNIGAYSVNFDAGNLPSGMYICTLTAGEFMSSKKMMLLK